MKKIIIMLLLATPLTAQWRWSNPKTDSWTSYDKAGHGCGSSLLYCGCRTVTSPGKAFWASNGLGLVKEIKDALVPCEKYGKWGGEGFSYKDMAYNFAGNLLMYCVDKLFGAPGLLIFGTINLGILTHYYRDDFAFWEGI